MLRGVYQGGLGITTGGRLGDGPCGLGVVVFGVRTPGGLPERRAGVVRATLGGGAYCVSAEGWLVQRLDRGVVAAGPADAGPFVGAAYVRVALMFFRWKRCRPSCWGAGAL